MLGPTAVTTMRRLQTAEVDIVYDVHGPLPTADGRPPLVMIGQPIGRHRLRALASYFPDRTVVTYDPRGLGRSVRKDGRVDHLPSIQADDVHTVIRALGVGPVEMFASSGGAVTALALVAAYPNDVTVLVAHEPPLLPVLPDAEAAARARANFRDAYVAKGRGAGMAAFIAMTSWRGEFTDEYFAQPTPDPAAFGMPSEDDGSRDDPLLSDRSWAVTGYRPDFDTLVAAPTRIVIAVGEESAARLHGTHVGGSRRLLGQQVTVFPSHHAGFLGGDSAYAGPARSLRAQAAATSSTTTDRGPAHDSTRRWIVGARTVRPCSASISALLPPTASRRGRLASHPSGPGYKSMASTWSPSTARGDC